MSVYNRVVDMDIMTMVYQLAAERKVQTIMETVSGPYIDSNRNRMVEDFLSTECEWLYFWDTDVVIVDTEFMLKMIETGEKLDAKVIAIPYKIKNDKEEYCVVQLDEKGVLINYKEGELTEPRLVSAVGAGSTLIHRSVLEKMKPPYFQIVPNEVGGKEMPEDFYFCQKVRELGFNIAVDTRITTYHFAPAAWVHQGTLNI